MKMTELFLIYVYSFPLYPKYSNKLISLTGDVKTLWVEIMKIVQIMTRLPLRNQSGLVLCLGQYGVSLKVPNSIWSQGESVFIF